MTRHEPTTPAEVEAVHGDHFHCCKAYSPDGKVRCTRAPDHEGEHIAADLWHVIEKWSEP